MLIRLVTALMVLLMPAAPLAQAPKDTAWPNHREGDFVLKDYRFASGETLPDPVFIVLPDGVGRGGSSKPSEGLRTKFPHYRYRDIVETEYRMLTEGLNVRHLRLVLGSSMGGMRT